jgi:hypothetical protein
MEAHEERRTTEVRTARQATAAVADVLQAVEGGTTEVAAAEVDTSAVAVVDTLLAEVVDTLPAEEVAIHPVEAAVTEEDTARAYEL